jgi:uncharacterized membrane protein YbhN (UPF0104 family)
MSLHLRSAAGVLLLAIVVVSISAAGDLALVWRTASRLPGSVLIVAAGLLATGTLLSGLRLRQVLGVFRVQVPWATAMQANAAGIVGGLLAFQAVGQLAGRAVTLTRHGVDGSLVLAAIVYERAAAMLTLGVLATAGSLFLIGAEAFALFAGAAAGHVLKLCLTLAIAVPMASLALAPRLGRLAVRLAGRLRPTPGLAAIVLSTLALHATTLAAFVVLAHAIRPAVPIGDLTAASLIVMLAASLPIGIAGWGPREAAAVAILGMVGLEPGEAFAVAVVVGLLSTLVVGIHAPLLVATAGPPMTREDRPPPAAGARQARASGLTRALAWGLAVGVAILICFHLHLPIGAAQLNVNLADPFAVAGGLLLVLLRLAMPGSARLWRVPHLELLLLAASGVLAAGFLVGWLRFGVTEWALANRLTGWLVLLGYLGTGALPVATAGRPAQAQLLKVLLAVTVAIAATELLLLTLGTGGAPVHGLVTSTGLTGVAQNANAFALQLNLALAIACLLPAEGRRAPAGGWRLKLTPGLKLASIVVLLLGIYFCHSRTGYVLAPLVLASAMAFGALRLGQTARAAAFAILAVLLLQVWSLVTPPIVAELNGRRDGGNPAAHVRVDAAPLQIAPRLAHPTSDRERWQSIEQGVTMWLEHPLLGAGLGAFIREVTITTGRPLVIHNTSVWLLAELGLVGFLIFGAAGWAITRAAWRDCREASPAARILLATLLVMAIAQFVHDVLYQRIFWFLLGVTLAAGRATAERLHAAPTTLPKRPADP